MLANGRIMTEKSPGVAFLLSGNSRCFLVILRVLALDCLMLQYMATLGQHLLRGEPATNPDVLPGGG